MKRSLLLIICLSFIIASTSGQEQKNFYVSGSAYFNIVTTRDYSSYRYINSGLRPDFGFNLNENWQLGMTLVLGQSSSYTLDNSSGLSGQSGGISTVFLPWGDNLTGDTTSTTNPYSYYSFSYPTRRVFSYGIGFFGKYIYSVTDRISLALRGGFSLGRNSINYLQYVSSSYEYESYVQHQNFYSLFLHPEIHYQLAEAWSIYLNLPGLSVVQSHIDDSYISKQLAIKLTTLRESLSLGVQYRF